jgi:hypothetical protein
MSAVSVLALLLDIVELITHWAVLRWMEYGLGLATQALAVVVWWASKREPRAVVWSCPYCSAVQGDQLCVQVHIDREHR